MAAVLEVVTILERLPITKEALEVNCRRFSLRVTTLLFNIFPVREKKSNNYFSRVKVDGLTMFAI